jgi:hypothetical protein
MNRTRFVRHKQKRAPNRSHYNSVSSTSSEATSEILFGEKTADLSFAFFLQFSSALLALINKKVLENIINNEKKGGKCGR